MRVLCVYTYTRVSVCYCVHEEATLTPCIIMTNPYKTRARALTHAHLYTFKAGDGQRAHTNAH